MTDPDFRKAAAKVLRLMEAMTDDQRVRLVRALAVLSGDAEPS